MYKTSKTTLVDLNSTKIYLLKIKKDKHGIFVKIVFSVDKKDSYYKEFVKSSLTYTTPDTHLVKLEDYSDYLSDRNEYNLTENKEAVLIGEELPSGAVPVYLSPCPHKNLLNQRVRNLLIYNHKILNLSVNGLFIYNGFVENTNTTRGILKDLRRLHQDKKINTDTSVECWLLRTIKSLSIHWN